LPPERFVYCISNHDQVGNRAFGERLHQMVSIETWRAASALLCLGPGIPLLFMGQEWATSAPFLYFTDHVPELGRLVEEGRRREFEWVFRNAEQRGITIPSPQAPETFESSKLRWNEITCEPHPGCLALYRELLALRRTHRAFRPMARDGTRAASLSGDILALRLSDDEAEWLILCDLHGGHHASLRTEKFCQLRDGRRWRAVLNSNEARFGGLPGHSYDETTTSVTFTRPEVLLLQAA
jgi:maltooligosyltrehalose trehalohydrolase